MIKKLEFKTLDNNECAVDGCLEETTAEGFACRMHWDMAPGFLKEQHFWTRKQLLRAIQLQVENQTIVR